MWGVPGSELVWLTFFIGALTIALLYERSPSFRYRLKFGVYIAIMQIAAIIVLPISIIRPKNVKNLLLAVPFIRGGAKLLGIRYQITGAEILAKDFPCVIICNHQSMLDILAMMELWPTMKKCATVAKKEVFYVFPFGPMAWLCGTIFIDRRNSGKSQMTISTTAEKIREEKTKMWIFPEGTRSKKENLLPFKKGAFHIALMHKLPIVPIVISPYTFIDDKKKRFDSGTLNVKILNPIDTTGLQYPEDVSKLAETCHELMDLEFQKMKKEVTGPWKKSVNGEVTTNAISTSQSNGHSHLASNAAEVDEQRRIS